MTPLNLLRLLSENSQNPIIGNGPTLINRTLVWDRFSQTPCLKKSWRGSLLSLLEKGSEKVAFEKKLKNAVAKALILAGDNHPLPASLVLILRREIGKELEAESIQEVSSNPELAALLQKQVLEKERLSRTNLDQHNINVESSLLHKPFEGEMPTLEQCQIVFGLKEPKTLDFLNRMAVPEALQTHKDRILEGLAREQRLTEQLISAGQPIPAPLRETLLRQEAMALAERVRNLQPGERVGMATTYGQCKMTFFSFCQILQAQPLHLIKEIVEKNNMGDLLELFSNHSCENSENFARALYHVIMNYLHASISARNPYVAFLANPWLTPLYADQRRQLPQLLEDLLPETFFQELSHMIKQGILGNIHPSLERVSQLGGVAFSANKTAIAENLEAPIVDWIQRRFLKMKTEQGWSGVDQLGEDIRAQMPPELIELLGIDPLLAQGPCWLELEQQADGTLSLELSTSGFALQQLLTDPISGRKYRIKRLERIPKAGNFSVDYFYHLLSRRHEGMIDARRTCRAEDFFEGFINNLGGVVVHNKPGDPVEYLPLRTQGQLALSLLFSPAEILNKKFQLLSALLRKQVCGRQLIFSDPQLYSFASSAYRILRKELDSCPIDPVMKNEYEATLGEIGKALEEKASQIRCQSPQERLYQEGFEKEIGKHLAKGTITREDLDAWRGTLRASLGNEVGNLADQVASSFQNTPLPSTQGVKSSSSEWNLDSYANLYSTFGKNILELALAVTGFRCGGWYRLLSLPMAYRLASSFLSPVVMEMIDLLFHLAARTIAKVAVRLSFEMIPNFKNSIISLTEGLKFEERRHAFTFPVAASEMGITVGTHFVQGFHEARNQLLSSLEGQGGYLVLENARGERKVALQGERHANALTWRGAKYLGPLSQPTADIFSASEKAPVYLFDITAAGELHSQEPEALIYLLVLELLKEDHSPRLASLWENILEATYIQKNAGKNGLTEAWTNALYLGFAYSKEMPYVKHKLPTEKLALYRARLFAHLQKYPELFGKPNYADSGFIVPSLTLTLIDLNRLVTHPEQRQLISREEEFFLYQFLMNGIGQLLKEQLQSLLHPPKEGKPRKKVLETEQKQENAPAGAVPQPVALPNEKIGLIKSFIGRLEENGGADFVEHFFLSPQLVKRWRKLREESGFKPTYLNQALRFFCEFSKASCELPTLNPFGSQESHEPLFKETEGGLGRSLFEFLSAARRTLLDDLNGERIIEHSWPEINPEPPLDPALFTKEDLERHFFSYYHLAQGGGNGKAKLKALLAFHHGAWGPHPRSLLLFLKTVADNAFLFTSTPTMLRFLLLEYFDYSPLLDQAVEINPEELSLDSNLVTKDALEKHFFAYYATARGEHGHEKKAQLNTLLDTLPRGNSYLFKLLYLLKAVANFPVAFDSKNDFIRYLEEEKIGNHPRSQQLQNDMQTATLTDKVLAPFMKYQCIYRIANAALGGFTERLGGGNDPITLVAYERALASVVKGDEKSALVKKGAGYIGLRLLNKLPLETIGHSLAAAATYAGLVNPATGLIGTVTATVAIRFGITRLLKEPFTWRHVVPAPTYTLPVIKGAVKSVKALSAMYAYSDTEAVEGHKEHLRVDYSPLNSFKIEWENYFGALFDRLRQDESTSGKVLLELHLSQAKLLHEKKRFESNLLALFNITKTELIAIESLQQLVHKGDWGSFAKEPFNLTPDLLPQLALALERIKIYQDCLSRCLQATEQLEKFIETPTPEARNGLQRAFLPPERGQWDSLIEALAAESKVGTLIAVKMGDRQNVIQFWKAWKLKTRLATKEVLFAFTEKDEPEYLANAILTFKSAKEEGLPLIFAEADLQVLLQIHETALPKSQQRLQSTLLLQMLDQAKMYSA